MKKKVAQANAVMLKAEQKKHIEELVVKKGELPTERFLIAHFGNGDEDDQKLISEYFSRFGAIKVITIFPGISYGFLEYQAVESA